MPLDPTEAARIIKEVVVPNLEGSAAFRNRDGDNEQRMQQLSDQLASALSLILLSDPAVPAAAAAQLRAAALLLESSPGWVVTKRQNSAQTLATTKVGIARKGIADGIAQLSPGRQPATPSQPDTPSEPPTPVASIFREFGWFAVRYDALFDPATLADTGVKWVAAVLTHGANADGSHNNDVDDKTNQAWLAAGNAKPYRDAGIKVGGWGWHEVMPETEAIIAATHIASFHLDFWIANAEAVWKPDDSRFVRDAPERYALALDNELESRGLTGLAVGWSVLGAPPAPFAYGYDYKAFTRRGWHILPQAYPQQSPEYELDNVLEHSLARAGIRPDFVHPTIANYGPQKPDAFKPTIAEWSQAVERGRTRGVIGYSLWSHDWQPEDARTLGPNS
ncbi:MAG: hypothetical protein ACRDN6_08020 [Gaiellaceae bacterium]